MRHRLLGAAIKPQSAAECYAGIQKGKVLSTSAQYRNGVGITFVTAVTKRCDVVIMHVTLNSAESGNPLK